MSLGRPSSPPPLRPLGSSGGMMGQRIRGADWSATPLGPLAEWPQSLRTAVGICIESRFPMAIWWGPGATQIYNDGYVPVLGAKHPRSLGQSGMECWAEIWDVVGPLYDQVMRHGRSTWSDDLLLVMDRFGYLEETYFTFSYSPIREESGDVGGLLITCTETTERVIGERRLRTLRDIGACSNEAQTVVGACERVAAVLAANPEDVPAAAVYLREPGGAAASRVTLAGDGSVFPAGLVGMDTGTPTALRAELPAESVVVPVTGGDSGAPLVFLAALASPRRRMDDAYRSFFELLSEQIASGIVRARAHEETLARREAEAAARASEERYRAFIELTSEGVWRVELETPVPTSLPIDTQIDRFYQHGYLAECNDAMAHMYGYAAAGELVGARLGDLLPREDPANVQYLQAFIQAGYRLADTESNELDRDGRPRHFVNNLVGVVQDGLVTRAWGSQRDVTERHQTFERLQQAQRMESVGKLAGGIAHEVNNMMSVVLGCADFVLRRGDLAPEVRADVAQAREAAERSAAITAQLLAFSRRQLLQPVPLDLNAVVRDLEPVLRRTLGERVSLELRFAPLMPIRADRGQLQQVLINLALNAHDAMPQEGQVVIETRAVELGDAEAARYPEIRLRPGPYALLSMSDTGHGMDAGTLARVFEPFFTTKGVGMGTGLGLSTVYGIVKQSEGYIWVDSTPGRGATFRVYLPLIEAGAWPPPLLETAPAVQAGPPTGETVLVVDDEPLVRIMIIRALREEGYEVVAADGGASALDILEREGLHVRLVVTDIAMAGLGGRELGQRILEARPGLPVLYMSGYPEDEVMRRGLLQEHQTFIQKPFAPAVLAQTVRMMLGSSQSAAIDAEGQSGRGER